MNLQLHAIVTLLALVNPGMCAAIFLQVAGTGSHREQLINASRAALTVLIILVLAALVGAKILHLFGVSLDAFKVAGGGVLAWIGFTMLQGSTPDTGNSTSDPATTEASLTPLILFAASPGTITGVITLAVDHSKFDVPITALIAVAVTSVLMWLVLIVAIFAGAKGNSTGFARDTVTRFMGLIVIAMGVQFALTGVRAFMG